MRKEVKLIISVVVCLLAGAVGSLFTTPAIPVWYASLAKPVFNPPSWLFGPVWTLLFIMMGIAFYLVWRKEEGGAMKAFMAQLVLNVIWSVIFFGFRNPSWALVEIIVLWVMILVTMMKFFKVDRKAGYLLVPYLLWVSFATILNVAIVVLN
ncbi:MAG: TspO/MBR family protein [archaeon]